jgi:hypothetical protein
MTSSNTNDRFESAVRTLVEAGNGGRMKALFALATQGFSEDEATRVCESADKELKRLAELKASRLTSINRSGGVVVKIGKRGGANFKTVGHLIALLKNSNRIMEELRERDWQKVAVEGKKRGPNGMVPSGVKAHYIASRRGTDERVEPKLDSAGNPEPVTNWLLGCSPSDDDVAEFCSVLGLDRTSIQLGDDD